MKPKDAAGILWGIFIISTLATLVSCASRSQPPQVAFVLPSKNMDEQAKKIFDQYNAAFLETVSSNWWNLLDRKPAAYDRGRGKVILNFSLHSNGQVTDMKILERSVSVNKVNVCEKAVLNGVPYQSWSDEILEALKTNRCDVTFTFKYL